MILNDRIRNWRERIPQEPIKRFAYWIAERHSVYKKKQRGFEKLTDDPILETYKFTNPFREHDRTTVAFRKWTKAHDNSPFGDIIFNTCLFRMIGTSEFFDAHGWVGKDWSPQYTKDLIEQRLRDKQRCFTGAYVITNQGLKLPKGEVVVDHFLRPIYSARLYLGKVAHESQSLYEVHKELKKYQGFGGGGFMAYEVVTDLNYTPVLRFANDRYTWANAGPGAIRGLNRLKNSRVPASILNKSMSQPEANKQMFELLQKMRDPQQGLLVPYGWVLASDELQSMVDMRCIEHSLCEWDKYERVLWGQGKPRSLYKPTVEKQGAERMLHPERLELGF
jgi:hypothetical protein